MAWTGPVTRAAPSVSRPENCAAWSAARTRKAPSKAACRVRGGRAQPVASTPASATPLQAGRSVFMRAPSVPRVLRDRPGAAGGQIDLGLRDRPQVGLRLVEEPAVGRRGLPIVVHDAGPQAGARQVGPPRGRAGPAAAG